MTEDPGNLKSQRSKRGLTGALGGGIGVATGLAVGKLMGFESFWLGIILVVGCTGIAVFLVQKIASK
jgi:transketolase N-terminal domain/subunit